MQKQYFLTKKPKAYQAKLNMSVCIMISYSITIDLRADGMSDYVTKNKVCCPCNANAELV